MAGGKVRRRSVKSSAGGTVQSVVQPISSTGPDVVKRQEQSYEDNKCDNTDNFGRPAPKL
jgi:hypothetical protein